MKLKIHAAGSINLTQKCSLVSSCVKVQQCEEENQTDGSFVYLECLRLIGNSSAHLALPGNYFPLQVAKNGLKLALTVKGKDSNEV